MSNSRSNRRWTAKNTAGYEAPAALAVDAVVLTVRERDLMTLLLERDDHAKPALPGGFVGPAESAEETATRKLREKTGLEGFYLEQLAAFTNPRRDLRGWIPSVAFLALVPPETEPTAPGAGWVPARSCSELPFDHAEILRVAQERVAGKLWWSNVAVGILPEPFTLTHARHVYEAIAGTEYEQSTFGRDLRATGLIEQAGESRVMTGGRPARLWTFTTPSPAWGRGHRKRVG